MRQAARTHRTRASARPPAWYAAVVRWIALALLTGCLGEDVEMACFQYYSLVAVEIVTPDGTPIDGLTATTTNTATGATVIHSRGSAMVGRGQYLVVEEDVATSMNLPLGTDHRFRFEAASASAMVTADYVIHVDVCRHVAVVSGPARLVLQ